MKLSNETIRDAVKEWLDDEKTAKAKYGHISDWDTSEVTDMSELFMNVYNFNESLENWDVSNVVYMMSMFENCKDFNQPISKWNIRTDHDVHGDGELELLDLTKMFFNAKSFNQSIDSWPKLFPFSEADNIFFGAHKDMVKRYGVNGENIKRKRNNPDSVEIKIMGLGTDFYYKDDEGKEKFFIAAGIYITCQDNEDILNALETEFDKVAIVFENESDTPLLVSDLPNILDSDWNRSWLEYSFNEKPLKSFHEAVDLINNLKTISFSKLTFDDDDPNLRLKI